MVRDAEPADSHKRSDSTLVRNKTDENSDQSKIIKLEPVDADEEILETETNHSGIADSIQEQMKLEPIDIKDEPLESNDEEINDDETNDSYNNENNKPTISRKRKSWEKHPEVVKHIPNKCYICDTILKSKDEFNDHLGDHSNMLPYKCTQCSTETRPIIYSTLPLLNRHFESHGFNYTCPYCELKHRRMNTLVRHIQTAHNDEQQPYVCETCGKKIISIHTFRKHIAAHENIIAELYKCESCQQSFPTRFRLSMHHAQCTMRLHTEPQISIACEKTKNTRLGLIKKTDYNDGTPGESSDGSIDPRIKKTVSNKCYICDRFLLCKKKLNVHIESHRSMLPYTCPLCSTEANPVKILSLSALNKHFERHGYYYVCPKCPLPYRTKKALQYHIRNDHGVKDTEYTCETCEKVYTNKNEYQNHVYTHRDMRMQLYKCERCQMHFSARGDLYRHQETIVCMSKIGKESEVATVSLELSDAAPETVEHRAAVSLVEENDNNVKPNGNDKVESTTETKQIDWRKSLIAMKSRINQMLKDDTSVSKTSPISPRDKEKGVKTVFNKCYICKTIFEKDFEEHLKSHEYLLPYKCPQCVSHTNPIIISNMAALNEHFQNLVCNFICPHCPLRYGLRSELDRHILNMHESREKEKYRCETCGKALRTRGVYLAHMKAHQNLITQKYKCEPCNKIFSLKQNYLGHIGSKFCLRTIEMKSRVETTKEKSSKYAIKEGNDQSANNGLDQNDANKKAAFVQYQIERESIDIKDEPPDSFVVIDDDEMTHS